ncbi:hypothetical protein GCM10010277_88350 [Streptomyces longisporoflavus]|nr:hypothetical protein GCM10010277_88350 [Streptomyces longisporoflavus]
MDEDEVEDEGKTLLELVIHSEQVFKMKECCGGRMIYIPGEVIIPDGCDTLK